LVCEFTFIFLDLATVSALSGFHTSSLRRFEGKASAGICDFPANAASMTVGGIRIEIFIFPSGIEPVFAKLFETVVLHEIFPCIYFTRDVTHVPAACW